MRKILSLKNRCSFLLSRKLVLFQGRYSCSRNYIFCTQDTKVFISSVRPFVHSSVYSFIRLFVRSFVHSSAHSFVPSFIHSFIPSSVHSFIRLFVRSFVPSSVRSFIRSFVRSFVPSSVRSFLRSFVHSFVLPSVRPFVRSFVIFERDRIKELVSFLCLLKRREGESGLI